MIAGLIKKIIPDKAKVWLVDKVIDGTVGKIKWWFKDHFAPETAKEKEVIPPTQKFIDPGTGSRLGRGLDKRKKNPNS